MLWWKSMNINEILRILPPLRARLLTFTILVTPKSGRCPSPPIEWVVDGVEGLANIAIHRFSMNNNVVIRLMCLLVQRSALNMLGKPACSGFCSTTVFARLFRFHCWSRAAFFMINDIHVQTTPTRHEYYCSRSWAVESDWSVGKLWMAMFARLSTPSTTHSIGGEGQRPD